MHDIETPVLSSILESNRIQVQTVVKKLSEYKGRSLGFLGLSFKGGTDDLRESPLVELVETMIGKGFAVKIYDKYVSIAKLMGANKEYIEKEIPHISSLMCISARELIQGSDVIVVGNTGSDFKDALLSDTRADQVVIDLVRILGTSETDTRGVSRNLLVKYSGGSHGDHNSSGKKETPMGIDEGKLIRSIEAVGKWVEDPRYKGYEYSDGLLSPLKVLTFTTSSWNDACFNWSG